MKQWKLRDGNLQITSTILLLIALGVCGFIIGVFIVANVASFIMYDEILFPQLETSPLSTYPIHSPAHVSSCNSSSNASLAVRGVADWIAPKELWHSMSDEELIWRASMMPRVEVHPYRRTAKVAFMFLTRGRLPLRPIWEMFFKGHEGLFSIYLHTSPDFKEEPPESSVFFRRRIPSKPVGWGSVTMIDAERRLLANALLDFSNERFVLLSETCIPLFNFTTIYNYLINSNYSFLSSFDDPRSMGRGRYNKRMWPLVSLSEWRKGSQWFEVHRKLAVVIVSDEMYYPIFRDHCKPSCYVDEHYLATLVTKLFPDLNSNRTVTWVDWSRGGSHPTTFRRRDVSDQFLNRIRYGEKCTYNGSKSSICVLFARKFDASTLDPLLRIAPKLLGFDN